MKTFNEKLAQGREYREFTPLFNAGEKIVEGYATTFDDPYLLYKDDGYEFWETVDRRAFDKTDQSDVIMQIDHEGRVIARNTNGTLEVNPDEKGLHVRADLGGTELGAEIYNEVEGRYLTKMSMGFIVREDERIIEKNKETGMIKVMRRILDISKLFDVSIVSLPANDHTSIATRAYCEGVIAEVKEEVRKAKRARQRQRIKIMLEATK
ncbi:MAG: HK97 family phage prohead protease [Lachnospiraceae bacterium]|nr:HK97 family phage prohead protease [Lachnospiraceae bacterium]